MRCWGRTKSFKRCGNACKFLFCQHHWQPALILLLITIPSTLLIYRQLFKGWTQPLVSLFQSDQASFDKKNSYLDVLILPFDPLEDCVIQESDMARTIYQRLLELKETDSLQIEVRYDPNPMCPVTFDDGRSIGERFNADLVIWGQTFEKCEHDTSHACVKYVVLKSQYVKIQESGDTGIQQVASMMDIKQGYLQKDIDYILYWTCAIGAHEKEDYQTALKHLEKIDSSFQVNNFDWFFRLAYCYYKIKAYDKCEKAYLNSLLINPNHAPANNNYAVLLVDQSQNYVEARKHYQKAIALDQNLAQAHYNYAILLAEQFQNYTEAEEQFQKAIEIDQNDEWAHYAYALLLTDKFKNYREAKKHYQKAIEINPNFTWAHNDYALLLARQFHNYKEAEQHYQKAIKINPNDTWAHNNYANLLAKQFKNYKKAEKHYKQAIEIDSNYATAHTNYAILLEDQFQKYKEAEKHYQKTIEIDPNDADVYYNYSILLANHLNNYKKAQDYYLKACELDSKYKTKNYKINFNITKQMK